MMKRIVLGLAALAAFQAAAITATKEYVDRSTNALAQAVAQMVPAVDLTPATNYTDSAIQGLAGQYLATTGGVVEGTTEFNFLNAGITHLDELTVSPGATSLQDLHVEGGLTVFGNLTSDAAVSGGEAYFGNTYISGVLSVNDELINPLNLITTENIAEYVPQPDLSNYASKQNVSAVSNLAASAETKANTLISYVNGDDVMDVVTNYDSAVHISSRSLRQRVEDGGTNYWRVVWDEMNRWNWFLPQIEYQTNALWSALSEKADRAWGFYDSHTGGWSPDGYLQISAPKILIAKDMAYQRHVVTGGAVWVLESNGLVAEVGGVASNGFFRISDDDGNALFEIVKGDKRTIGSTAGALTTTNIMGVTHLYITYAVEAAEHPTIEATTSLGTPFVSQESVSSPVNVTWTGSTGDYHAEVWPKSASSSLFVRASHEIGGETYIKNTAPTGLDGGLIYNGVKYRVVPYSSGGKTYLTLEAW